jgi:acyl-CoA thioesterase
MTTAYERAKTFAKVREGRRKGRIDESWHQGRGAFGGLLAATTLSAMLEDVNDAERIPRSLTLHFCAPAAGEVELATEIVRTGSRVTHATFRIEGEKGVATVGSASFCRDRPGAERYVLARMPEVAPVASLRALPAGVPGIPAFFQHVDARFGGSTMPFSSAPADDAKVMAWVRLREPAALDAPVASLLLDSLPPAITATFGAPRAVASVDFTIHFFAHLTETDVAPDEHCLVAITSRWADDGYTEEVRDLWSPRGVLLAQCRQLIALL